ncbi:hypothetical protein FIU84_02940 [Stutzerimonas frequens]|uniref:hypothetical protein n=1 Tax=Gammaproteobacteria TaxID=1236 RepID=UPI0012689828|nr:MULTISPECIES: hypothetical protein [Stutzerimonas stutzeri group]QFU10958.1 hypothetical protein FIU84_02940 [Stutzerimonas frequens]UUC81725.1 hypothetical protein NPN27_12065 [Stutzerimonas stutzeri]
MSSWMQSLGLVFTLLSASQASLARIELPAQSYDLSENSYSIFSVDTKGRNTIVLYADELDLGGLSISPVLERPQRTPDIIVIAQTLRIGPRTTFLLDGQYDLMALQDLRGGDLYLIADTLIINGQDKGSLISAMEVNQGGGYNPSDATKFRSRDGQTLVFVNKVELAPDFIVARTNALNIKDSPANDVPPVVMKIMSRAFSPGNSIHKAVEAGTSVKWNSLGDAVNMWLDEEPLDQVAIRELGLVRQRVNPFTGDNLPDVAAMMVDANKYVPSQILSAWYVQYFERSATIAQTAVWSRDYERAAATIRIARSLAASAPASAKTDAMFKKAISDLQTVENKLTQESVVEDLTFPIDGGPPLTVTVIRDLVGHRISIIPHQVLLSSVQDSDSIRFGFMSQSGEDVHVIMRGQLTVDPSVFEHVRRKFPDATSDIRVADNLIYDTINLGMGNNLVSGGVQVKDSGSVVFDLVLKGSQFVPALLRLAQPFGIDASVHWKHPGLNLDGRTSGVNIALGRTEFTLMARNGALSNPTSLAVDVDYVMDGGTLLSEGFPLRIAAGQSINLNCVSELCYAPGSALRWVLPASQLDSWLVPIPLSSSVTSYVFENHLDEHSRPNQGRFLKVALDVTYAAAPNAVPQNTGTFILGPRGTTEATRAWPFIISTSGVGKFVISGRAYWEYGYHDLLPRAVEGTLTTIDDSWLAK